MTESPSQIQPVRRRKLSDDVVETLEQMIVGGALQPNEMLPSERELMARFDVGRPTIREALISLKRVGLVEISNGERARVSFPTTAHILGEFAGAFRMMIASEQGMRNFQAARRLLEMALTREAARSATAEQISKIEDALEANRSAQGKVAEFERTNVAFHLAIASVAGNPLYSVIDAALTRWLAQQIPGSLTKPDAAKRALQFHKKIFKAIAARDPDAAENAMARHLSEVERGYWQGGIDEVGRSLTRQKPSD